MIWERLGVITDEVSQNVQEALDWSRDQQLKHVEIRMVNGINIMNLTEEEVEALYQDVRERGLFVSAIASPLFKCLLDPARPLPVGDQFGSAAQDAETHHQLVHKAIAYAKLLRTKYIRIFSFWREDQPQRYTDEIVNQLKRAADAALAGGVVLLLENELSCNGGYSWEVAELVRKVDSPALKVLWDPGNEERTSPAYPQGYAHIRDLFVHFHLKHWYVDDEQATLLPQLKALQSDGYSGLFTIETHFVPEGGTPMDGTRMTIERLRERLKEESFS